MKNSKIHLGFENFEVIKTEEDAKIFVETMENIPEPNDKLKKAFRDFNKQETLEKYSERFNNKDNEVVDGIFNPENWGRRVVKQETLEEVAENYAKQSLLVTTKDGFIAGAKWQKNRLFTNDEVIDILQKRLLSIGVFSSYTATEIWFKQFKKK